MPKHACYERLPEWEAAHGVGTPAAADPALDVWELHDLTTDPEERRDRVQESPVELANARP